MVHLLARGRTRRSARHRRTRYETGCIFVCYVCMTFSIYQICFHALKHESCAAHVHQLQLGLTATAWDLRACGQ